MYEYFKFQLIYKVYSILVVCKNIKIWTSIHIMIKIIVHWFLKKNIQANLVKDKTQTIHWKSNGRQSGYLADRMAAPRWISGRKQIERSYQLFQTSWVEGINTFRRTSKPISLSPFHFNFFKFELIVFCKQNRIFP